MRDARTTKKHAAEVHPKPEPSILDKTEIKYAAPCTFCNRKQKIISIEHPTRYYNHDRMNVCATCLLAAAIYLLKFKREE